MYAHAVEYCAITIFSRIALPTPVIYSAKYSATMALMTLFGAWKLNVFSYRSPVQQYRALKNNPEFFLQPNLPRHHTANMYTALCRLNQIRNDTEQRGLTAS